MTSRLFLLLSCVLLGGPGYATSTEIGGLVDREAKLRADFERLKAEVPYARLVEKLRQARTQESVRIFREGWSRWVDFESSVDAWNREKRRILGEAALARLPKPNRFTKQKHQAIRDLWNEYQGYARIDDSVPDQNPELGVYKRFHKSIRGLVRRDLIDRDGVHNEFAGLFLNPRLLLNQTPTVPKLIGERESGPGETPLLDSSLKSLRREVQAQGVKKFLTQGGSFPSYRSPEKDTITYIAHTHSNALYDYAALSFVEGKGYGVVGHLGHALPGVPEKVIDVVRGIDHVVDVGRNDTEALDRITQLARSGKLSAYHVATQAATTDGLYSPARNSRKFDSIYVKGLQKRGFRVRTIFVTLPDSPRLMDLWRSKWDPQPQTVRIQIGDILEDADLRALDELSGDRESVGRLLRFHWFTKLDTNEKTFLGMPPVREIARRIERFDRGQ